MLFRSTQKVPIGIISCDWGGTVAEAWTSPETLKKMPDFAPAIAQAENFRVDLNQIRKEKAEIAAAFVALSAKDSGKMGPVAQQWWQPGISTKAWDEATLPGMFDKTDLKGFDGIVWYRKDFELKNYEVGQDMVLSLAMIDDLDSVWFNGTYIGTTEGWDTRRNYVLPNNLARKGKNTVVVKVVDFGGGGGIYGEPLTFYAQAGDEFVPFAGTWLFRVGARLERAAKPKTTVTSQNHPGNLFNGMLNPLIPYGIKGVIWYQGESNASRAEQYRTLFPTMIADWRRLWAQGDFPFLFVQLANYQAAETVPEESEWAELREAQAKTLSVPATGMACSIDIGEENDIHPKNKRDVGHRLALQATNVAYGGHVVASGPRPKDIAIKGNTATIAYENADGGLVLKSKYGYLNGFAVAGADGKFRFAQGAVAGNKVELVCPAVPAIKYVRYGWANNPSDLNLFNKEGLPAEPFRTDTFVAKHP